MVLLVAVLALAGAVATSLRRPHAERVPCAVLLFGGFAAWGLLGLWWGQPAGTALVGTWSAGALVAVVTAGLGPTRARRVAEWGCVCVGGLSASAVWIQFASGLRGHALHGGHGNPDWLGLLLAVTLLPSVGLAHRLWVGRHRAWPVAALACVLQLAAMVLARSHAAWVALAVGCVVAAWGWRRPRAVAAGVTATALAATLVVGGPLLAPAEVALQQRREPSTWSEALVEAGRGRLWIWRRSAEAAGRHLPLGTGAGRFAEAYLEMQGRRLHAMPLGGASRRFENATTAHNDWLHVATVSGVPGVALLALTLLVTMLSHARRRWKTGAGAVAVVVVAACGDVPLHQPALAVVLGLLVAATTTAVKIGWPGRVAKVAALVAGAWLLAVSSGAWLATRQLTLARQAPLPERLARLERAAGLDPRSGEVALARGLALLSGGEAPGALSELERSRPLLANVGTHVAIGNAHAASGQFDRAAEAYRRALMLHPAHFRAHANLAVALIGLGQLDQADHHLAAARQLWPGHPGLPAIAEALRRARISQATGAEPETEAPALVPLGSADPPPG